MSQVKAAAAATAVDEAQKSTRTVDEKEESWQDPPQLQQHERNMNYYAPGPRHPLWEHFLEVIASKKEAPSQDPAEQNVDMKDGDSDRPLNTFQLPRQNSRGPQANENAEPGEDSLRLSGNFLDLRKDTPGVGHVENTALSRDEWPTLQDKPQPAPDKQEPVQAANSNSDEQCLTADDELASFEEPTISLPSTPVEKSFPVEQSNPLELAAPVRQPNQAAPSTPPKRLPPFKGLGPVDQWPAVGQCTPIRQRIPAEQPSPAIFNPPKGPSFPHPQSQATGSPAFNRLKRQLPRQPAPHHQRAAPQKSAVAQKARDELRSRKWMQQAKIEKREARVAQRAQATQLNPAAQSFTAAQAFPAAQVASAAQLNPAAQSFAATQLDAAAEVTLATRLNPAVQPFPARQAVTIVQAVPTTPWNPISQSIPTIGSRLYENLISLFIHSNFTIPRRKPDEPDTVQQYNQIHFGGTGRSKPKGDAFIRTLFRKEPAPPSESPPLPTSPWPPSSPEWIHPCTQASIDEISLDQPYLPKSPAPCGGTLTQAVNKTAMPKHSVQVKRPRPVLKLKQQKQSESSEPSEPTL